MNETDKMRKRHTERETGCSEGRARNKFSDRKMTIDTYKEWKR
jgi:hypothetical protein